MLPSRIVFATTDSVSFTLAKPSLLATSCKCHGAQFYVYSTYRCLASFWHTLPEHIAYAGG
jgi:hypothetical protein